MAVAGLTKSASQPLHADKFAEEFHLNANELHGGLRECGAPRPQGLARVQSLPMERVKANALPVKPGMCLAEWSAARKLTPRSVESPPVVAAVRTRRGQQGRVPPVRSNKILRPRSHLKSIEEAAEASQLDASLVGLEKGAAGSEESPDDEEPDAEEPEAPPSPPASEDTLSPGAAALSLLEVSALEEPSQQVPSTPKDVHSPGGGFCLHDSPVRREAPDVQEGSQTPEQEPPLKVVPKSESELQTPPLSAKCIWSNAFAWAAALEREQDHFGGTVEDCSTDLLKPWKWEQLEASKLEPTLAERTGGCSLPPLGASACGWVNQDNHLVLQLSPHKVLVAVFDGHGEDAALAARRARSLFEQQAAACLEQTGVMVAEGLRNLFGAVHEQLVDDEAFALGTGASAAAAVVDGKTQTATIAHVGDPKVMITNRWGVVEFETVQHFANPAAIAATQGRLGCNTEPLDQMGGLAACCRPPRTHDGCTGLCVAHVLSDWEECAMGVRAMPFITPTVPLGPESALVAASGTVWEMIGKQAVVRFASTASASPEASALSILRQARYEQSRAVYVKPADVDASWPSETKAGGSLAAVIVRGGSS